ncbi:MAG: hypothetical protein QOH61_2741 [Chloroflexota bacterium]|jgi:hypothetical protein|nr:hypothetical protein [Chloroflexota bacterium]
MRKTSGGLLDNSPLTSRIRASVLVVAASVWLACTAPLLPSPDQHSPVSSPLQSGLSPSATGPTATATESTEPTSSGPVGFVHSTLAVEATFVALASDRGAWFGTVADHAGRIGFVTPEGKANTVATLPVVALAANGEALFAAEIANDVHGGIAQARIEKFDPVTLESLATRSVDDPTGLVVSGDSLWVATATGMLDRLSTGSLLVTDRIPLFGEGWATVAAGTDSIWVRNAPPSGHGHIIHRFDREDPQDIRVEPDGGSGSGELAASGGEVYAFLQADAPASGALLRLNANGTLGAADVSGAPGGITLLGSSVWWVSNDGVLGAVDANLVPSGTPIALGTDAACLTAGAGYLWVCTADGLVLVQPSF